MTVLDPVSDVNGVELCRFSKLFNFPDFVKKASLEDTVRPSDSLQRTVYADPANGRYPCHTPAATWLSALYFNEKRAELPADQANRIGRQLERNIKWWGIGDAVETIKQQKQAMEKAASNTLDDDAYAIVWSDENNNKSRHCRMANAAEVKVAAEWLQTHRDAFAYQDRLVIARKILEKAAQYGCNLGDTETFIERQAGRGFCDPAEVIDMLQKRAKLANNPTHREAVVKLAGLIKNSPRAALSGDMLCKLAATVEGIDRGVHLFGKYSDMLPRPEDVIFKLTYKEAQAGVDASVALTTGNTYDRNHFEKISLEDVRDLMGSDFAAEIADGLNVDSEKLAAVAGTLPLDDAELFEKLLSASGIPPIRNKTAGDRDDEAVMRLAQQY